MANKALSKRQKLMIRNEPARALKPRNPVAVAAKQRAAGSHRKDESSERQLQQKLLNRLLNDVEKK